MRYVPLIDSYRAIAALLVVFHHYFSGLMPAGVMWNPGGTGVNFFFVLSGFLITSSLLADRGVGSQRLVRFYTRRSFRIFPLYFVALLIGVGLAIPGFRESLPYSLVYLNNFHMLYENRLDGYAGHFWTLAIEEQFYLFWPLVIIFLPRGRAIAGVCLALAVIGLAYRYLWFSPERYPVYGVFSFARFDVMAIGALIAVAVHRLGAARVETLLRWSAPLGLAAAIAGSFPTHFSPPQLAIVLAIEPPLSALFYAWLVALAWSTRSPRSTWLSRLGRISYGVYVYHVMMLYPVRLIEAGTVSPGLRCAAVVATVLVAWLSWRLIENPLNRFGKALSLPGRNQNLGLKPVHAARDE